ncbi:MAG: hypothetical protein MI756_19365 [Chromatiales bacterium]|nr:hypothetical protein [Chromatiales bacterium]
MATNQIRPPKSPFGRASKMQKVLPRRKRLELPRSALAYTSEPHQEKNPKVIRD